MAPSPTWLAEEDCSSELIGSEVKLKTNKTTEVLIKEEEDKLMSPASWENMKKEKQR